MAKLTPEQEAYRIERLRAALKGKPQSQAQIQARVEAIKRAHAEGRVKKRTRESIEKGAAKLRGLKRPAHVVEKINAANRGKKRTQAMRDKMRERALAQGCSQIHTPEAREKSRQRLMTLHQEKQGDWRSPEGRARHIAAMTGRKQRPEIIAKRTKATRGRPQTAPATAAGPTNQSRIEGEIRDAAGRVWKFSNLSHFVRTHPDLFEAGDLIERSNGKARGVTCNAIKRLLALFGHGKYVPGTWKGWTAVSTIERMDRGADLLGRDR